ncbi:hypothetical protein IEQ_05034 [Bacillus cereus BAG6X1-2]|nr:hypothetical protein IEQ_05034 [Bacillus cereus BAG6X1-2]
MMYLNINYEKSKSADYFRLLCMYRFASPEGNCCIKVCMYILDKLIKKGENIG